VRATDKFKHHPNVSIINSDSLSALHEIVPTIPKEDSILFFLDAHFPGEVEDGFDYQQNLPRDQTLPLEQELTLIDRLRPDSEDVIIVDDLKIYEDGNYANGNIVANFANIHNNLRNLDFLQSLFPRKVITRSLLDDGYLIIQPRNLNFELSALSPMYRIKRTILKNYERILGV
jgi:hypothetical protein